MPSPVSTSNYPFIWCTSLWAALSNLFLLYKGTNKTTSLSTFVNPFGPLPATLTPLPSVPVEAPVARGVLQLLTPRALVLVLQPRPRRLKRKKQSMMGNGVLHSKHQKRAKPTPPSSSIPGLERGAKGEEVLFSPPHAPPHPIPQVLQEPKGQQWRIKGDAFPRAPHYPSNARWYFAFLKFLPLRPLPPN